jgi:hypothetical protein
MTESEIRLLLGELGLAPAGEIVRDDAVRGTYYVFLTRSRDSRGRPIPSEIALNIAKSRFLGEGISLEFVLSDDAGDDIEAGLRATLIHAMGDIVRNVFLAIRHSEAHVWIDAKRHIADELRGQIWNKAADFLAHFELNVVAVSSTAGANIPSDALLMRTIRILSPVEPNRLLAELTERGHVIPSSIWLMRRLDSLRKSGMLVRLEHGTFAMTAKAVANLGSKKGRTSPDVSRMLALAYRRR